MNKDELAKARAPDRAVGSPNQFQALKTSQSLARHALRGVLGLQTLRLLARLGFSAVTAFIVGRLVMEQAVAPWLPLLALFLLAAAAAAGFVGDRVQAAAETHVATALREVAARRLDKLPARRLAALPAGRLIVAMQRHPESVASLVIGHSAARQMMAIGPLVAAATLVVVSWDAAALVIGLTPVMIVFFALVGDAIRRRALAQEQAFGRLAGQFADRIRTLPTILANHGLAGEEAKLAARLQTHARKTMGVLAIAFVNAGIIDFFASLSIAMLAVFLGLGHLKLLTIPGFSNLALWQSLFILMIAPDYFAPFRRFSEQYHAKAEGLAAAEALDQLLDAGDTAAAPAPATKAFEAIDLPPHGLIAVVGPSGSGKSSLLRKLAGIDASPGEGGLRGPAGQVVWIATDSFVPPGTLAEAIAEGILPLSFEKLEHAATAVGLLDDILLPGGLEARLERGGGNLSGGQKLRIALARAILSEGTVIADEPTAKLDATNAARARQALVAMAHSRLVIVATHDRELAAAARQVIDLTAEKIEVAA